MKKREAFSDDKEPIDRDWLSEWAKREPHVWSVPGTNLAIYYNQSGLLNGIWTILETLDDGDEMDHCHVVNRGECRRMIDLITAERSQASFVNDVTLDELVEIYNMQSGICAITGVRMTTNTGSGLDMSNISIDRIDCSVGYTKDNVRLVCVVANYMRNALRDEYCREPIASH